MAARLRIRSSGGKLGMGTVLAVSCHHCVAMLLKPQTVGASYHWCTFTFYALQICLVDLQDLQLFVVNSE